MSLPIDLISDVCDQVGAWQDAFLSETSLDRYRRAAAWAMSETAKAAKIGAQDALDEAFDNPTPWMNRAFTYRRALTRTGDIVEADTSVLPSQSIVLKYAMGDGPQVRRPGDVGLAKDQIYVPYWKNLRDTQRINFNQYGNHRYGTLACDLERRHIVALLPDREQATVHT